MKKSQPEYKIQCAIVQYLSILEKQGKLFFFAIPGQGGRGLAKRGAMLKKMGVKAGMPDLCILYPDSYARFIEIKSKGGKESPAQNQVFGIIEEFNFDFAVVRSLDEMVELIAKWGID